MKTRLSALILLLLALAAVPPTDGLAAERGSDLRILSAAGARLGHAGRHAVIAWLRRQPAVRSATLGRDRQTVNVLFRDGLQSAILPTTLHPVRLPPGRFGGNFHPFFKTKAPGSGKALVLEPFATELGLGPDPGAPQVNVLQNAGFDVTQLSDENVSIATMAQLWQYNVVYMQTHSGLTATGDGIVASGQLASNADPSVPTDGTVFPVTVAGSSQVYLGISSGFIQIHEGRFPAHSLVFFNGCKLLPSTAFSSAMLAQGAGVLLGWSDDATTFDDYLSGAALFNVMAGGAGVSAALQQLYASNLGHSQYGGVTATLGFAGDGNITLQEAAGGGSGGPLPSPTSVPPTATATRTPAPTATATATATKAPRPTATATTTTAATSTATATATPLIGSLQTEVKEGDNQTITIRSAPDSAVTVEVAYPDGQTSRSTVHTNAQGTASLTYMQRGGRLSRSSRTATVTLRAPTGAHVSYTYLIAFRKIDLVVTPRKVAPGNPVTVFVHTRPRTAVTVTFTLPGGKTKAHSSRTGGAGWARVPFTVGKKVAVNSSIRVQAIARLGKTSVHAVGKIAVR